MARPNRHQKAFSRPDAFPPVASVYRMFNTVGMSRGHEAHVHPETLEICFVIHGWLEWWLGDKTYSLHSGDLWVAPPGHAHGSADSTLQPCEYCAVHFDVGALPAELVSAVSRPDFGGLYSSLSEAGVLVQRIFREHEQPDSLSPEVCRALAITLLSTLSRENRACLERKTSSLVNSLQKHLTEFPEESNSVSDIAKSLGVSVVWLNRKFHQELGVSPAEWLRSRRILEAKRLLADDRVPVTEAAIRLGYRSSQYFATAFRRETGFTPSEYRERTSQQARGKIALAPI